MKANIKQISEMTGYSPATISKALNQKKGISQKTMDIVKKAAEEIGYRSSPSDEIRRIRLIFYKNTGTYIDHNIFCHLFLSGAEKAAQKEGIEITFYTLDKNDPCFLKKIEDVTGDSTIPLLLLGTEMQEEDYRYFKDARCEVFIVDGKSKGMPFPSVSINNEEITEAAVNYLIQKGHREIGYIKSEIRIKGFEEREDGYYKALRKAGIQIKPEYIATIHGELEAAKNSILEYLKKTPDLPSAFVADNDMIAMSVLQALEENGYQVPDDISVIGIDDIPYAAMTNPPLTTFRTYLQVMGEIAVEQMLQNRKRDVKVPVLQVYVKADLIERNTVKDFKHKLEQ